MGITWDEHFNRFWSKIIGLQYKEVVDMPSGGYGGPEYDPRQYKGVGVARAGTQSPQETSALLNMCTEIHQEIDAVNNVLNALRLKAKPITVERNEPKCEGKAEGIGPCSPLMEGMNHARSRIRSLGIELGDFMRTLEV